MIEHAQQLSSTSTAKSGLFKQRPGQYIRQEFLDWVRDTGRPDTWQHHTRTKPPADRDFEELERFAIPAKHRTSVGRASCPICSPDAPKYFSGALAWFPAEGVLRAIGHECADSHFGTERANAARAAGRHHAAVEAAQNFLLDTLPQVAALREEVQALSVLAKLADDVRHLVWLGSGKAACAKLAKMGESGVLSVEVVRAIDAVDAFGKNVVRYETEVVGRYAVAGMSFISRRYSVTALATQTSDALALVRAIDQEAALDFIVDELKTGDYLFQADKLARNALEYMDKLRLATAEAKTFLTTDNLANLAEYTRKGRWSGPVHFDFNPSYPARFRVKNAAKKWRDIGIPPGLR